MKLRGDNCEKKNMLRTTFNVMFTMFMLHE